MAEPANPSDSLSAVAEGTRRAFSFFDSAIIVAMAALVVAAATSYGTAAWLFRGLAVVVVAAIAAIAALTFGRQSRGVFLTPMIRIIILMMLAVSVGILAGARPTAGVTQEPAGPRLATDSAMFDLRIERAALQGQLAAKTEEARDLRAALEKSGTDRDEAVRRANERLIEAEWRREQERRRLERLNRQAQPQPPVPMPTPPTTENQRLARAWSIPEEQVETQKQIFVQHPFGRNVIESILREVPLLGPALGNLFGGSRVRSTTVRAVQMLQAGTIPAANDLLDMFVATDDPTTLTADLFALIDRGLARGVISREDATAMKREIDAIRNNAAVPVSNLAEQARDVIARALNAGQDCSVKLTDPNFTSFGSLAEKQKLIATTADPATRRCLEQYPVAGRSLPQ